MWQVCPGPHHAGTRAGADSPCWPVPLAEGRAFELNNAVPHRAENKGTAPRVHLIIDAGSVPRNYTILTPGQVCTYAAPNVVC